MSPKRWEQVKGVLAEALECETRERTSFLNSVCADDSELRLEVQALLDQPPDEFENVAARIGIANPEPFGVPNAGQRLGAYELIRELGRGGMGAVWLARRADQVFEKLVAIKLLKRGTDTDEVLSRFHAERKILAALDHPNIARLLDAGTTPDGLPYFVMEYVEGARLIDFVREQELSLGERLQLFLKICGAVQFAHQNLVVHRDLKPANILVTPAGEPKLLDFGVAKLLAAEGDARVITLAGRERFTPGYASPEQVRGDVITTVSDVYSLGALLYEMLTAVSPHRFSTATPTVPQIARAVCEQEPARPSSVAIEPEIRRQLRGDLDTIILRALAKTPERRYLGAGNLADDLRRYLENKPVRARPDTFGYRAGKFLRRNKKLAAAAALILLSLLVGVVATTRETHIARRERARAERRFNEVRKMANSLLSEFYNLLADLPGTLAARQLVAQRAASYLDSLAQEAGDDLSLKSELVVAYEQIGTLTFDLKQATSAHQKAKELAEALVSAAPENPHYQILLADCYDNLSDMMKIAGRSRPSIDYARKALALTESAAALDPSRALKVALGQAHGGLAVALSDAGDFRGALQSARQALRIQEELLDALPDKEAQNNLTATYSAIAEAAGHTGETGEAMVYARKAFEDARASFEKEPSNRHYRRTMWATHFRLGRLLEAEGDRAGALEHYRSALDFLEGLASADPADTGHRRWLAVTYSALGDTCAAQGELTEAFGFQERAMAIAEKLSNEDPARVEARQDLVKITESMGRIALAEQAAERALIFFQRALPLAEKLLSDDPENARMRGALADLCGNLAVCYCSLGEQEQRPGLRQAHLRAAREFSRRSVTLWQEVSERGMLSHFDAQRPAAAARLLAKCDALLAITR